jgi:homoserine kinase
MNNPENIIEQKEAKGKQGKKQQVSAFAPATVANVVCGFDIFGFAVNEPGDVVNVTWREEPGVVISKIIGDGGNFHWKRARIRLV